MTDGQNMLYEKTAYIQKSSELKMRSGFFEPRISLDETGGARRLIFCTFAHIVTLTGATEGIFEFRSRS